MNAESSRIYNEEKAAGEIIEDEYKYVVQIECESERAAKRLSNHIFMSTEHKAQVLKMSV